MNAERCIAMLFYWKQSAIEDWRCICAEHFEQTFFHNQEAIDSATISIDATKAFFSYKGLLEVDLDVFDLLIR